MTSRVIIAYQEVDTPTMNSWGPSRSVGPEKMLTALVAGPRDPDVLTELARGRLRAKLPACPARGPLPDARAIVRPIAAIARWRGHRIADPNA